MAIELFNKNIGEQIGRAAIQETEFLEKARVELLKQILEEEEHRTEVTQEAKKLFEAENYKNAIELIVNIDDIVIFNMREKLKTIDKPPRTWYNPQFICDVRAGNRVLTNKEYNELVDKILRITSSYKMTVSDLDNFFKEMIEDIKNNIIPD